MLMIFELMKVVVRIRKLTLIIITIIFLIGSSYIIHWIEPDVFPTPFIGFWYVMTTVTTTGYGDFVPETTVGKVFGLFLYFFGIGLIGIVIGKIVEGFGIYRKLKEEGKLKYKGSGHYVIIGWSNKAKHTMKEILAIDDHSKIVLIDLMPKSPMDEETLFYIQGDPTDKEVLEKANVLYAKAVLIFTKDNVMDSIAADGKSLIIVSSIESYAKEKEKEIYTLVEILKEKHIPTFEHANVDEFILADEALSDLMAKSAVHRGSGKLVMKLLSRKSGVDLWKINKHQEWKTYNDAFEDLKRAGANLISDRNDFNILTKLGEPIPAEAELYIICNKATYQKIK
ncbi:potassium channel family protein [Alkalihalobacterium chitinilyticum]|uniref:Potassium channel family protein n=1 Tax=Alkalihalobacterium chitinilyticum TaxID=2980103 RepID=A0ABT5VDW3_9BACI|nr:potassium channel family protein [Alkalihalobacterium chitinilyticum]MDE5413648.1 potassium channel family protein [Alkalihalobacterium chitinilyticum]